MKSLAAFFAGVTVGVVAAICWAGWQMWSVIQDGD
jgi:hypothetical protein